MNFPHLLESYHKQVAALQGSVKLDEASPRLARSKASAEQTLASYYMANNDDRYRDHSMRPSDITSIGGNTVSM